ncbi:MAG: hypothetical protein AAF942_14130 [Pseudomonadota bacterium]
MQGLQGLHAAFALHGLQAAFALHGLQGLHAAFALHGLQAALHAASWIFVSGPSAAMADGRGATAAVMAAMLSVVMVFLIIGSLPGFIKQMGKFALIAQSVCGQKCCPAFRSLITAV